MTLYIVSESWTDGRPPALHINCDLARVLSTLRKILAENNVRKLLVNVG